MRSHTLDVYGTQLHLCTKPKHWKQLRKTVPTLSKTTPDSAGQVTTLVHTPKRGLSQLVIIVWIDVRNHADPGEFIDTAAHEASHAAGRILEHTGHEVPGTDEPHAYLVGWLTRWIYEGCTT